MKINNINDAHTYIIGLANVFRDAARSVFDISEKHKIETFIKVSDELAKEISETLYIIARMIIPVGPSECVGCDYNDRSLIDYPCNNCEAPIKLDKKN